MNWMIWIPALFMALVTGYLYGKTMVELREGTEYDSGGGRLLPQGRTGRVVQPGWYLKSPVNGTVERVENGGMPCLRFVSMEGRVYAPADGRITRIFPVGNMLRIETGQRVMVEVGIEIGDRRSDELSDCFRPRVVQGEVVEQGKLLLEFDRAAIEQEELEPFVSLRTVSDNMLENRILHGEEDIVFRGEQVIYFCPGQEGIQ